MDTIGDIPEIQGLDARRHLIRIPHELDVPLTPRVRQIIDTVEFRRLARISQLGLVSLVYPAAHHTRFEHALGVYRMALLYLKRLSYDARFSELVAARDAEVFIVAALLHDLGHWPFCHPIEDIRLPGVPEHELFANSFLLEGEIADTLRDDWGIHPREVVALLSEKPRGPGGRLLQSMLSGPIDVDKMDYLYRDSLHAGVPYGQHFDQQRLIGSLCLNAAGDGLAITDKGRTAAEMMVFSRYVMFSEVYWHHAVRAGTAMLQRAFYLASRRAGSGRPVPTDRTGDDRPVAAAPPRRTQPTNCSRGCSDRLANCTNGWHSTASSRTRGLSAACPAALPLAGRVRGAAGQPASAADSVGASPLTKSSLTPRPCNWKSSSISMSTSRRRTATVRWVKSRRSFTRWPESSSTTTSSAFVCLPTRASSTISGGSEISQVSFEKPSGQRTSALSTLNPRVVSGTASAAGSGRNRRLRAVPLTHRDPNI